MVALSLSTQKILVVYMEASYEVVPFNKRKETPVLESIS